MRHWIGQHAANLITLFGIVLALSALYGLLFYQGRRVALGAVILCACLDGLDGRIARYFNQSTVLGKYLDAGHDFIAFGLLVSGLVLLKLPFNGFWMGAVIAVYLAALIFRLIRHLKRGTVALLIGLPAPLAGMTVALITIIEHPNVLFITMIAVLIVSVLMVGPFTIKRPFHRCR